MRLRSRVVGPLAVALALVGVCLAVAAVSATPAAADVGPTGVAGDVHLRPAAVAVAPAAVAVAPAAAVGVGPAVATPAAAVPVAAAVTPADLLELSPDGVHFSSTWSGPLFTGGIVLVPGSAETSTFYARNDASDAGTLVVTLTGSGPSPFRISVSGGPERALQSHGVVLGPIVLAAGEVRRIDVTISLPAAADNSTQNRRSDAVLTVGLGEKTATVVVGPGGGSTTTTAAESSGGSSGGGSAASSGSSAGSSGSSSGSASTAVSGSTSGATVPTGASSGGSGGAGGSGTSGSSSGDLSYTGFGTARAVAWALGLLVVGVLLIVLVGRRRRSESGDDSGQRSGQRSGRRRRRGSAHS